MMTYYFYFKNSEPVYETEYVQSLKQFAVQEVFLEYVLNWYPNDLVSYTNTIKQAQPMQPMQFYQDHSYLFSESLDIILGSHS